MLLTRSAFFVPVFGTLLMLGACATAPLPAMYQERAFLAGETELDCTDLACAARWRSRIGAVRELYDAEDWRSLATMVTNLRYGSDLAYFYLGRAAEEMQALAAARNYYQRALNAPQLCGKRLFNDCHGIDVPARAQGRAAHIAALLATPQMDLVEAQTRLRELGLYTAKVDGISGPRTLAAIRAFQRDQDIDVSGELDPATLRALADTDTTGQIAAEEPEPEPVEAVLDVAAIAVTPIDAAANEPEEEQTELQLPEGASGPLIVGNEIRPAITPNDEIAPLAAAAQPALEPIEESAPATASVLAAGSQLDTPALQLESERTRVKVEVELLTDADPFADVVSVVEQGSWVTVINRGEEWSVVSHENKIGYVYTDILQ